MGNRLNEAIQKVREDRHKARRYTALLLVLAMLTSMTVSWNLHQVGTALTTDDEYYCGLTEHVHDESCYTRELVCGYEEGEIINPDTGFAVDAAPEAEAEPEPAEPEVQVHYHTDDCYEEVTAEETVLTCEQEEHVHDQYCYDDDGNLNCGYDEHTHDDSCYTTEEHTERKLICGYEEGEEIPVETQETENSAPVVFDDSSSLVASEPEVHHHTDDCYAEVLTCGLEEHTHTAACLANPGADVEDEDDWEQYSENLSGFWNEALIKVAQEQLGYTESEKNFQLDEALGETLADAHRYTRYGAWYGNPYGEWDFMFVAFCQHYAGIPKTSIPRRAALDALVSDMDAMNFQYFVDGGKAAVPGDIITYNNSDAVETIGIVEDAAEDTLTVISGDVDGQVAEVTVSLTDVTHTIMVDAAYMEYAGIESDHDTMDSDIAVQEDDSSDDTVKNADGSIELDQSWIKNVEVTQNDKPVTGPLTLNDGDEIILKYEYIIPKGKLPDNYTVTYQLPDGVKLKKEVSGKIEKPNTSPTEYIGDYTISPDGKVTLVFDKDKVSKEADLLGDFFLRAYVDASGAGDDGTITIPIPGHEITVNKKYDLSIKKSGADPVVKNGKTYIRYTVEVDSTNGYNQDITISDILNDRTDSNLYPGTYDQTSFKLVKKDADGKESTVDAKPTFKTVTGESGKTCNSFEIKNLEKLDAGESYILTYDVEVGNLPNETNGEGNIVNYAKANDKKTPEVWKYFAKKIEKSAGVYDEVNNVMKWTVTVNNPYGFDLSGTQIEDTIGTEGALITGSVTIKQDVNGWDQWTDYTDSGVTIKADKSGFNFTFPDGSKSKKYKFEYTTTVPAGATVVNNKVSEKPKGGGEYDSSNSGNVTTRDWSLSKSATSKNLTTDGKASWNLELVIPASWDKYTITDEIGNVVSSDSTTYLDAHYALASELQKEIESNLKIERGSGGALNYSEITATNSGIGLEIKYYDANDTEVPASDSNTPVKKFTITIKNNGYTGAQLTKLTVNPYTTHVDTSKIPADADVVIYNTAGTQAKYEYHKPSDKRSLIKTVYKDDGYSNEINGGEIDYNENTNAHTNLYYQLFLGIEQFTEDEITITDKLPEGLVFDSAEVLWYIDQYNTNRWNFKINNCDISQYFKVNVSEDGRTITFKLSGLLSIPTNPNAKAFEGLKIRYKVHVEDSAWDKADTLSRVYPNYAEWGTLHDKTSVTVKRDDKEVITKTGEQIAGTTDVQYSIVVNPNGADLLEGHDGNITLKDEMEVDTAGYTATLDVSSIKVYKYPKEQNPIPLGVNDYEYTVKKDKSNTGRDQTTLTFTLLNKTGYVIEYTYKTDAGYNSIKLKNTATVTGGWSSDKNNKLDELDSGATGGNSVLTIYKVDAQNYGVHLKGAKFKLYTFKNGALDDGVEVITGTDGMFQYSPTDTLSGNVQMEYDTLYRLEETEAPAGYTKSDAAYYFIWLAKGETNTDAAYNTAVGNGNSPIGKDVVTYYKYGASGTIYVPNKRDGLVIEKKWENKDGSEMTNPPVDTIEVELWKFLKTGTKTDAVLDRTIELTKDNDWKVVLKDSDLDASYYYYVKEITNLGEDYTVSYGTTNEGKLTGTITIVNKSNTDEPGYELPSTGSTGTTPYTAGGALIMGAALMYGYYSKRKRGRRAE